MQGSSLQNFQSIELKPQIWERSFRENAKSFKNRKIDYFEGHILLCKFFFAEPLLQRSLTQPVLSIKVKIFLDLAK